MSARLLEFKPRREPVPRGEVRSFPAPNGTVMLTALDGLRADAGFLASVTCHRDGVMDLALEFLEQVVDIAWLEANDVPTLGLTAAARQKAIGRLSAK
jgi:hypothetical protein